MTPEQILLSLYNLRAELEGKAIRKYQMGIGIPYPKELKELDEQIKEAEKRVNIEPLIIDKNNSHLSYDNFIAKRKGQITALERQLEEGQKEEEIVNRVIEQINKPNDYLSSTDKKKLFILEKLKEEWDLMPNKNNEVGTITVSWQRLIQWEKKCGVDYNQLKNILLGFQNKGLIETFELYNPAV